MSGWRRWARFALLAVAALLLAVTILPLFESDEWWIRLWDFPRLQIAALIAVVLAGLALVGPRDRRFAAVAIALVAALLWQLWRVAPYTPPWPVTVPSAERCAPGNSLSLLNANVLLTNRDFDALLNLVREREPDMLLLLETGPEWARRIAPLYARYPHRVGEPLDNTYGIILLSKLPLEDAAIRHLVQPDIPSVKARVRLPSGAHFDFYGLHPEPPVPGDDSGERDAELVLVGSEVRDAGRAAIVLGDLNDVAWSDTSKLFRDVSGMEDPRVGRGMYASFPVDYPFLRYPLDHAFVTPHFTLQEIHRLRSIGSDHFPMWFRFCLAAPPGARHAPPEPPPPVEEDVRDQIDDGREERAEERSED